MLDESHLYAVFYALDEDPDALKCREVYAASRKAAEKIVTEYTSLVYSRATGDWVLGPVRATISAVMRAAED